MSLLIKSLILDSPCEKNKNCEKSIPNSSCLFNHCRCKVGFAASRDNRKCLLIKKLGQSCSSNWDDDCRTSTLHCDLEKGVCQCAPGFVADPKSEQCLSISFIEGCTLHQLLTHDPECRTGNNEFVMTSHRPRFSVLTFFILVVCCLIILRKNSSNTHQSALITRRPSRSAQNSQANEQMLNIFPYTYGVQRPRMSVMDTQLNTSSVSLDSYQENHPPPAYDEIFQQRNRPTADSSASPIRSPSIKGSDSESNSSQPINVEQTSESENALQIESVSIQIPSMSESNSTPSSSGTVSEHQLPTDSRSARAGDAKPPTYDEAINMPPI